MCSTSTVRTRLCPSRTWSARWRSTSRRARFGIWVCPRPTRTIRKAHSVHPISVLQSEYSIFTREVESLFPGLEDLGIGFVAYSPLARGFLSGAVFSRDHYDANDFRRHLPWWDPQNFDANLAIVDGPRRSGPRKDATSAQLALAWLLTRRDYVVPIPGSRNPSRVAQNIAASDLVLDAEDLRAVDRVAGGGGIGNRN
nr:hypothetical protein [Prescottella equi]